MPKVITFTANLLAETTYYCPGWQTGKTHRAREERFQVGGKGINVSKMLNRLHVPNRALCFPGGNFGPACENWLKQAGIETLPFIEGCETRSGSIVRSEQTDETTFLGLDSKVSERAVEQAVAALAKITEPFIFAICGSVPSWESQHWQPLRDWIKNRGSSVSLLVDSYGPSLNWFAEQSPELVKINRDELELLFPEPLRSLPTPELITQAQERYPCPNWIVTDGGNPIVFRSEKGGCAEYEPPLVDCVSATGCGDVFFATLICSLYGESQHSLVDAVKWAADLASRNAASPGIADFYL